MKKKLICLFLAFTMMFSTVTVSAKSKVKLNKSSITIIKGKTYKLKIKGTKKKAKWSSKNKKIATVTKSGKVKTKKAGTTYIYARIGKKKLKCKTTVKNNTFDYNSKNYQISYKGHKIVKTYNDDNKSKYALLLRFTFKNKSKKSICFVDATQFDSYQSSISVSPDFEYRPDNVEVENSITDIKNNSKLDVSYYTILKNNKKPITIKMYVFDNGGNMVYVGKKTIKLK